jgi:hypothetical protein
MTMHHLMPSRVTPGTCAELLLDLEFLGDTSIKEIGELVPGSLSFGVSTVASRSECIRVRETRLNSVYTR